MRKGWRTCLVAGRLQIFTLLLFIRNTCFHPDYYHRDHRDEVGSAWRTWNGRPGCSLCTVRAML